MDFIMPELPVEVESYLKQYDDLFTRENQHENFRYYVVGLLSETHRKNIESMIEKVIEGDYYSCHHFLADSPWDEQQVNLRRISLLQQDQETQMNCFGWWIQDDTGQERRYWGPESGYKGTDGVARQYIGNVGKVSQGLVFVSTHYADEQKHIPIVADLYWPNAAQEKLSPEERIPARCRDKIDIALDQIRWALTNLPHTKPRGVIADSWYGSNPRYFKTVTKELKLTLIAKIKNNKKIFSQFPGERGHPEHSVKEILGTLLKTEDFKPVTVRYSDGSEEVRYVAGLKRVKMKKIGYVEHLVVQVCDPYQLNPDEAEFFICTDKNMTAAEVAQTYALRNWVEVFYRDGKDSLGLDQAEVRREKRLLRHWVLVMIAYTMLETFRVRGDISKHSRNPLKTRGDVLQLIRNMFRRDFLFKWLQKPENLIKFIKWLCSSRGLDVQISGEQGASP